MERSRPPIPFAVLQLLGNVAFVGAWGALLWKPTGWQWVGLALIAVFLALRVGGMWWHARRFPAAQHPRRSAILTTVIAVLGVGLWAYSALRGTHEGPRIQRHVITEDSGTGGSAPPPSGTRE